MGIVMKKLIIAILTGLISVSSWSACTYNFDATQVQINAANVNGGRQVKLMPSINLIDQKGIGFIEYLNGVAIDQIVASSKGFLNTDFNKPYIDKKVITEGILASEFVFDVSNLQNINLGNSKEIQQFFGQVIGSSSSKIEIQLDIGYSIVNNNSDYSNGEYITLTAVSTKFDTNNEVIVKDVDRKVHQVNTPSLGKVIFDIYLNQTSKQFGYMINGVNYGYLNINMQNPVNNMGYTLGLQQTPNPNSKFIGKQVSMQLITDSTKMTQTYPIGTKDICGNTI